MHGLVEGRCEKIGRFGGEAQASFRRRVEMLYWTVVFLIVALVAGFFGFGGVASAAAGFAKILFFIFIVLFALGLVRSLTV